MVELTSYLAQFGLGLADLGREELLMYLAARNLDALIDECQIASLCSRSGGKTAAAAGPGVPHSGRPRTLWSRMPANEMEIRLLQNREDLPRILPSQWLIEEVAPAAFYARLCRHELLVPEWQHHGRQDAAASNADQEEASRPGSQPRECLYVLLDASRTMNDGDRRGTIARGLALAMARKAWRSGADFRLWPFAAQLAEPISLTGATGLRQAAARITGLTNEGQTRIQTALEQALLSREPGPQESLDIVLVSDGISRLTANPLGRARLHTFLLGDLYESADAPGSIETLRAWSCSFHRLWKDRFKALLTPEAADVAAAMRLLRLAERLERAGGCRAATVHRLRENAESLAQLLAIGPASATASQNGMSAAARGSHKPGGKAAPTRGCRGLRRPGLDEATGHWLRRLIGLLRRAWHRMAGHR